MGISFSASFGSSGSLANLYFQYYSEILNQILQTYETYGYKFLVFIGNEHEDTERRYIRELLSYKIEGMIILSHTIPSRELADLQIPIVTIEREDQYAVSYTHLTLPTILRV